MTRCHHVVYDVIPAIDDFLPNQPWSAEALAELGFRKYGEAETLQDGVPVDGRDKASPKKPEQVDVNEAREAIQGKEDEKNCHSDTCSDRSVDIDFGMEDFGVETENKENDNGNLWSSHMHSVGSLKVLIEAQTLTKFTASTL